MTALRPRPAPIPVRRWALDLSATLALTMVALVGFTPTFAGGGFLAAAIGGTLLGGAIAAVAAWRHWGILVVAGLVVAAYFVFGGALALPGTALFGVVPTLETLQRLAVGTVTSWKQLLTTVAPVSALDGHLIVPFLLALVAATVTASLALRLARVAWALIPAGLAVVLVIALGTPEPAFPIVQGVVFAVVTVVWLTLRQLWSPESAAVSVGEVDPSRARRLRLRRVLAGAGVLAVAGAVGVSTSALAASSEPRSVFRDVIVPPFDIRDYPSPLQAFRKNVRDQADETLFTVRGLPEDARIRIAVMDDYDGMVYNVTDGAPTSSGAFSPLRSDMNTDAEGVPSTLEIAIDGYDAVWVPTAGRPTDIRFAGDRADELRRGTYVNTVTGTAVAVPRLTAGDEYAVDTVIPAAVDDDRLAELDFGSAALPEQTNVPEELTSLAAETVQGAESPIEQVRALETSLSEGGFFSHGLEGEVLSRAGHTAERMSTLFGGDQMIGDDEQYAVAMTLLAGELGIPARVVMGYYPDETRRAGEPFVVTGDDVHAWVEVQFDGVGWLPFDPTPPEDQVPNDQNTKPRVDPKPQVLQPPPPPQEPVDLPPTLPDDRESQDETLNLAGLIGTILLVGGISLAILAVLLSPFIVIGAWKAARRRSRRTAARAVDRISGGWHELADRAVDYGARLAPGGTRSEDAARVAVTLSAPRVTALADRADAEVFGPADPTPADVEAFWQEVDAIVGGAGRDAGFVRRMTARLNVRSLMGGTRFADGVRSLRDAATARARRVSEAGGAEGSAPTAQPEDGV